MAKMNPLVSVIVPNYNHADFLGQRLSSIKRQSFTDFELILLDDASTDGSRELLETFRGDEKVSHIVFNDVNSGSTFSQWKKGIELARGKYIWIAESDDHCDREFLQLAVQAMDKGIDLFYCRSLTINHKGEPIGEVNKWMEDLDPKRWSANFENTAKEELIKFMRLKNTIPNASSAVFRPWSGMNQVLKQISGMRFVGDWIFWMSLLEQAEKVAYSVECCNYFRKHAASTRTGRDHRKRNAEVETVLKMSLSLVSEAEEKRGTEKYFADHHFVR